MYVTDTATAVQQQYIVYKAVPSITGMATSVYFLPGTMYILVHVHDINFWYTWYLSLIHI